MAATCPECDSDIDIDETDVDAGDELSCSECGALLRVASDSPLELELADDDEDLDEDDDEEEEEDDEDEEEDDDEEEEEGWGDRDDEE
jgi:DNA-directed RNA polymerase subunit M/transcription elongation factor TFIIS